MEKEMAVGRNTEVEYDLKKFVEHGVTELNNRSWAVAVRSELGFDDEKIIFSPKRVTITIPKEITSINTVFFEELFENVVQKIGVSAFSAKFRVIGESGGQYTQEKINYYVDKAVAQIGKYAY